MSELHALSSQASTGTGSGRTMTASATATISSHRQLGPVRVVADRLGARRLVDADGADTAVRLRQHIAADPTDVIGRPIAFDRRTLGRSPQLIRSAPAGAPKDQIGLHVASSLWATEH